MIRRRTISWSRLGRPDGDFGDGDEHLVVERPSDGFGLGG